MSETKRRKVNSNTIQKELAEVDKLFDELDNDKSLPSFSEHFVQCILLGNSERVNLKAMYPKTHGKISLWLEKHNQKILELKKERK